VRTVDGLFAGATAVLAAHAPPLAQFADLHNTAQQASPRGRLAEVP